jgi:hypothetical protein
MSEVKKPIEVDINGNPLNGHSKPTSVDDVIIHLPIGETVLPNNGKCTCGMCLPDIAYAYHETSPDNWISGNLLCLYHSAHGNEGMVYVPVTSAVRQLFILRAKLKQQDTNRETGKEIMPILPNGCSFVPGCGWLKVQRDADLAIYQAREAYYRKLSDELVEHTRKDERQQEAEWLEKWLGPWLVNVLPRQELKARIAYLRGKPSNVHDAPFSDGEKAGIVQNVNWPDGEGCKEK